MRATHTWAAGLTAAVLVVAGIAAAYPAQAAITVNAISVTTPPDPAVVDENITDQQGADDEPGQKDMNWMAADYGVSALTLYWGWDDTEWTGSNTGDACALLDSDQDGKANYAVCVTVIGKSVFKSVTAYTCSDKSPFRCTNPGSTNWANVDAGAGATSSDPFGTRTGTCSGPNCFTQDAQAVVTIPNVSAGSSQLINVCSYPSSSPNADYSDCVVTTPAPTLKLQKTVVNDNGGSSTSASWTLSATASATGYTGRNFSDAGNSTTFHKVFESVAYTLSESGPAGYTAGSWSCDAGTLSGSVLTVGQGQNVTCTITNNDDKATPSPSTAQSALLKGSLSLTGYRTGGSADSAIFRLYSDTTCTTQVGSDVTVSGAGTSGTFAMTNSQAIVVTAGTYYWKVTYSGNTYNNGVTSPCGSESGGQISTVTFTTTP